MYFAANRLSNWNYAANIYTASFPIQTDTYTYDNNGNRLTKQAVLTGQTGTPQQTTYSYDFENRLNQLQYVNIPGITGNQTDVLTYNGEGLRTQAVLNSVAANYSYDGMNILVERDNNGNTTKSYTRGLDFGGGIGSLINQNYTNNGTAVTQYYDYNDLGSLANTTTTTGTSANSYSYDAFGNLLTPQASGDTNRYLFSTKELDSRSGLQYFGARYYDPEIGRWLTQDPIGFVDGPNMYAYLEDNPINWVDPLGLKKGDKKYGLPPTFWNWYHQNWKSPCDPDASQEEAYEAYQEWLNQGKPNPKDDGHGQDGGDCPNNAPKSGLPPVNFSGGTNPSMNVPLSPPDTCS